ncbi:hypothetical protein BDU57DRAFT_535821 [Ampelomyces quisqualis]|uniref:Uncharacterized protein n=1 Tax=Ampelomyces quisqualis TaxID=50730 RepID=A0A6A5QTP5_AMPQU|nr:hypothetical protein BDU57DRAFT_535821 [Ampelomyces quisqualis]
MFPSVMQPLEINKPATEKEYQDATTKGADLWKMMRAVDHQALASSFSTVGDLSKHGYTESAFSSGLEECDMAGLASALQDLNVDAKFADDGGFNNEVRHKHNQDTTDADGIQYPHTGAVFHQYCNPTDGVMIAASNYSAASEAKGKNITLLPRLRYWSDVAYLQWLKVCGGTIPKPIRYVIRSTITNNATRKVLWKILERKGLDGYTQWPGLLIEVDSEEGKAILGTPNGASTAYMLIQHKRELGNMQINKVTVFLGKDGGGDGMCPSLCFWIA